MWTLCLQTFHTTHIRLWSVRIYPRNKIVAMTYAPTHVFLYAVDFRWLITIHFWRSIWWFNNIATKTIDHVCKILCLSLSFLFLMWTALNLGKPHEIFARGHQISIVNEIGRLVQALRSATDRDTDRQTTHRHFFLESKTIKKSKSNFFTIAILPSLLM